MIKKHLLSVAILFALTGCNDELLLDTAHQTVPAMPQAKIFDDINHNGLQDEQTEPTLTTTDDKGRFRLSTTTTLQGDLAVVSQDGTLVLRTPSDEKIISSLTDLVVIEMNKSNVRDASNDTTTQKQNAIDAVEKALHLTSAENSLLFSHFINEKNDHLIKTATHLRAAKISDPATYEDNALTVASSASNPIHCHSEHQEFSVNAKGERICNAPITINPMLEAHLQQQLDAISPTKGGMFSYFETPLNGLFNSDGDLGSNSTSSPITLDSPTLSTTGITASLLWGSNLALSPTHLVANGGTHLITLTMDDIGLNLGTAANPQEVYQPVSTTSVTFEFTILENDKNISINVESYAQLQNTIDQWQLSVEEPFSATLALDSLFNDPTDTFSHSELKQIGIKGLTSFDQNISSMTIEGTPLYAGEAGKELIISGVDKEGEHVDAIFMLPEVTANYLPPEIEQGVNIEDRFIYVNPIESLRDSMGNHLGSGMVCEIRYFNSVDSTLYAYSRTLEHYRECPVFLEGTIPSENNGFRNYGTYKRDPNSNRITLEMTEDNELFIVSYQAQEITIDGETQLLMHHSESMGGESMHKLNIGYSSTKNINAILAQPTNSDITYPVAFLDHHLQPQYLTVTASIPSRVEAGEIGNADANLVLHDMSCDLATAVYAFTPKYSIGGNPMLWDLDTTYEDKNGHCYVDFSSNSPLSLSIHTLYGEVNRPYTARYEDIAISFNNIRD